jgi:hypothetical protein
MKKTIKTVSSRRTLHLDAETIRQLASNDMAHVAGGVVTVRLLSGTGCATRKSNCSPCATDIC